MQKNTVVHMQILCHLCSSPQPHVWSPAGAFICLKCRSEGRNSFRFLASTTLQEEDAPPLKTVTISA